MAFLFCDGFDHYALADITQKWTSFVTSSGGGTHSTSLSLGRRSTNGFQCATSNIGGAATIQASLMKVLPASGDTFILGVALLYTGSGGFGITDPATQSFRPGNILKIMYKTTWQFWFAFLADGTIGAYQGVGTGNANGTLLGITSDAVPNGVRTYLEFKVKLSGTTSGTVEIRFDKTPVLDLPAVITKNTSITDATWNSFQLGGGTVALAAFDANYDDLYVIDGSGSDTNDFLNDQRVDLLLPNAAGTYSDWTRSTGADQYATIDETASNGDTDYNHTPTVGNKDTLGFPNMPVNGAAVNAIQLNMMARKEDAGPAGLKGVWRLGGTDYFSSELGVSSSYSDRRVFWTRRPSDSAAITTADVDGEEFGYQKSA